MHPICKNMQLSHENADLKYANGVRRCVESSHFVVKCPPLYPSSREARDDFMLRTIILFNGKPRDFL